MLIILKEYDSLTSKSSLAFSYMQNYVNTRSSIHFSKTTMSQVLVISSPCVLDSLPAPRSKAWIFLHQDLNRLWHYNVVVIVSSQELSYSS